MLTQREGKLKLAVPPVFRDTAVVRVTEHKFGPNSNDNPMITVNLELCGVQTPQGLSTTVSVGGKEYKIAGLRVNSEYFTLVGGGLDAYADFWEKANPGQQFPGVDTENPDKAYLDNLVMYALVQATSEPQRKAITNEEKAALKAAGKQPVGEPILDPDGKPILNQSVTIVYANGEKQWLKKFTGELPPF